MSQRILRIHHSDGTVTAVRGMTADIVYWILQHRINIERIPKGNLSLNWHQGTSFRPELRETFEAESFTK